MILSIDITEMMLGENIGAKLRADQAESDMRVARAEAEKRRAMAVAVKQENEAKLVEAQSQVPLAMAHAFEKGNLGIMDYQRIENVSADTQMRKSLAKPSERETLNP